MKKRTPGAVLLAAVFLLLQQGSAPSPCLAGPLSLSGRMDLRGVDSLDQGSVREDPSLTGRIKVDVDEPSWRLHSWLEGGWDGTVRRPPADPSLFKNFDEVYQSNTPYLEFKELYITYSPGAVDLRAGIQRFAWGRLDEYPPNDLFNPWDYTQFLRKSLEDRKIGVPSLSAALNGTDWTIEAVWVPWLVPYRLAMPDERWSGASEGISRLLLIPNADVIPAEPDLPEHNGKNGSAGLRFRSMGDVEWSINLFNGWDPRPVFRTTALVIEPLPGKIAIDPGYVPDFHRITVLGADAAAVAGDWSLRAEAAYAFNRYLNIRRELWGYPASPGPGVFPLNPAEKKHDVADYGIGADRRLFEDGMLTVQVQQTVILGSVSSLYENKVETVCWANLKAGWMNQKIKTDALVAYNPEHDDSMVKADAWYVFTDAWKAGVAALGLSGPSQSLFGRYSRNDQVEAEIQYSW